MKAYKVFAHDRSSPIQGGQPVWDGNYPCNLPLVEVDDSAAECGEGWHACRTPDDALRIAGLWRAGRPAILVECESTHPVIERNDKLRSASWRLVREADISDEILARLHAPMAGPGLPVGDLVTEVQEWRTALARPEHDPAVVERELQRALDVRGLNWTLKRFDSYRDARGAWDVWAARDACAAWDAWDAWAAWAAWIAWAARDARGAWAARDAKDAWDARAAKDARAVKDAWDAWAARDARDAKDALTLFAAVRLGWLRDYHSQLLAHGIRAAYGHGLLLALPTSKHELGWVMEVEV